MPCRCARLPRPGREAQARALLRRFLHLPRACLHRQQLCTPSRWEARHQCSLTFACTAHYGLPMLLLPLPIGCRHCCVPLVAVAVPLNQSVNCVGSCRTAAAGLSHTCWRVELKRDGQDEHTQPAAGVPCGCRRGGGAGSLATERVSRRADQQRGALRASSQRALAPVAGPV